MKGRIRIRENLWVIEWSDPNLRRLLIHPDDIQYCEEGKEVQFGIITDYAIDFDTKFASIWDDIDTSNNTWDDIYHTWENLPLPRPLFIIYLKSNFNPPTSLK